METQCNTCGEYITAGRWELGYRTCLWCGEEQARQERSHWCIAPLHKSNYVLITDKNLLTGVNQKGGIVK